MAITIEPAQSGAVVSGNWDSGSTVTCTTGMDGKCSITSGNLRTTTVSSTTFYLTNVALAGYEYVPPEKTDVTITKP